VKQPALHSWGVAFAFQLLLHGKQASSEIKFHQKNGIFRENWRNENWQLEELYGFYDFIVAAEINHCAIP